MFNFSLIVVELTHNFFMYIGNISENNSVVVLLKKGLILMSKAQFYHNTKTNHQKSMIIETKRNVGIVTKWEGVKSEK